MTEEVIYYFILSGLVVIPAVFYWRGLFVKEKKALKN